ncbi:hypothetical protein NEAUS04_0368 [Nematocida ausubeli]|nr:hypothetical protein NEAUS04_0277 [Nematocida ausubeli]KAI5161212.1 hypothetical protein NEAUS04_0368 [Nematocida ausubeli]
MHSRLDLVFYPEQENASESRNSKFYTRIFMEYFRKVQTTELDGMPWNEKQEVAEKVVGIVKDAVNEIIHVNSQAKKLELFIRYLSVESLSDLVEKVKITDVHNKNITYVLEAILKKIEQQKVLTPPYKVLIETVNARIQKNIMKSLKSKGTNHMIRVLLKVGHDTEGLLEAIKNVPIDYILEDSTRTATFAEYMSCVSEEERERVVKYLIKVLTVDRLKGYTSFLYEKVCRAASPAQLDEIFQIIKPDVLELCQNEVGNYFMQVFISVYNPRKIYPLLEKHVHTFQINSNVMHSLLSQAARHECAGILESIMERLFTIDTVMHTLLFHSMGGFDSKGYKLALKLMSAKTKYQEALQMQCVALYERYWLFNKIGQEVLIVLLRCKNLSREVVALLTSTMTKEFIGIHESKGGDALLDAIESVADRETCNKIKIVRRRDRTSVQTGSRRMHASERSNQ